MKSIHRLFARHGLHISSFGIGAFVGASAFLMANTNIDWDVIKVTSENFPAWLQAFGSLGALIAVSVIAWREHRRAEEQTRLALRPYAQRVDADLHDIMDFVHYVRESIAKQEIRLDVVRGKLSTIISRIDIFMEHSGHVPGLYADSRALDSALREMIKTTHSAPIPEHLIGCAPDNTDVTSWNIRKLEERNSAVEAPARRIRGTLKPILTD